MNPGTDGRHTRMTEEGPDPVVWPLGPTVSRADIPGLCDRLAVVIRYGGVRLVLCDVSGVAVQDAVLVEALLRLQLTARRLGGAVRVHRASRRLLDLLAMTGLHGAVTGEPPRPCQRGRPP